VKVTEHGMLLSKTIKRVDQVHSEGYRARNVIEYEQGFVGSKSG
jgi:hypothetical protein